MFTERADAPAVPFKLALTIVSLHWYHVSVKALGANGVGNRKHRSGKFPVNDAKKVKNRSLPGVPWDSNHYFL
ncbi:hypothetical protein NXW73_13940 [Bacteroides fragilis]|nr:hypothetical protein [Bacteroides fragilis]